MVLCCPQQGEVLFKDAAPSNFQQQQQVGGGKNAFFGLVMVSKTVSLPCTSKPNTILGGGKGV